MLNLDIFAGIFGNNNTTEYLTYAQYLQSVIGILGVVVVLIIYYLKEMSEKFSEIGKRLESASKERTRIELDLKLQLLEIKTIISMKALAEGITLEDQEKATDTAKEEFLASQDEN